MTTRELRGIWSTYRQLAPYARAQRGALISAGALTLVVICTELLRPWPIKLVLDQVILEQPWALLPDSFAGPLGRMRLLWAACGLLLLIAVVGGVAHYLRTVVVAKAGNRIVAELRAVLHDRLVRMSQSFYSRHSRGDLLVRLTGDAAMLKTLLMEGVVLLAQELLLVVGIAVVAIALNARLTAVAIVTMPLVTVIVVFYGKKIGKAARKQRKKEGQIATTAAESLMAVPEIQAYGLEERAGAFFHTHAKRSARAAVAAARLEGQMGRATDIAIASGTSVVLLLGTHQVLLGRLSPGEMLVFVSYVRALFKPLRRIAARAGKLMKASAGGERLLEILAVEPDLRDPSPAIDLGETRGDLRFSKVSYSYSKDAPDVLRELDLHIRAGEHVAILGKNGAGKSTLISLIPRLRDVRTGRVLLDGRDVRSIRMAELRSRIALVLQRTVLFDGTIEDNVRMGCENASDEAVERALRLSGVQEVASRLPEGVDTRVGEIGDELSGGQRQRVALARALVRDASVVIFDEPTNALDRRSIDRLVDDVLPALRDKTVLLVTHDPRLTLASDRAIVLDAGRVILDGSPAAALAFVGVGEPEPLVGVRQGRGKRCEVRP